MNKLFTYCVRIVLSVIVLVVLYVMGCVVLPLFSVSAEEVSTEKSIDIYILTNGVHTDIVLPTKTNFIDWSEWLPSQNIKSQQKNFSYIAIGWGDKGFYLNTPEWKDLKFSTAFKAAFGLSTSAMHCTYYAHMQEGEDCVRISVTENQYLSLIHI